MILFNEEYYMVKDRVLKREIGNIIINTLDHHGMWVKDMDFIFHEISDRASYKLYNRHSNNCIGKNDLEIAKEDGLAIAEDVYTEVCRFTDRYVLEHGDSDFIEMFDNAKGEKCLWKTHKGIKEYNGKKYFWGIAHFLEDIKGSYDNAVLWFNNHVRHCEKLNDNVYKWDMKELK